MTGLQISVLRRAASKDPVLPGTAAMFEQQAGRMRQVRWLLKRKLIRMHGGRYVATVYGRKVLSHMDRL